FMFSFLCSLVYGCKVGIVSNCKVSRWVDDTGLSPLDLSIGDSEELFDKGYACVVYESVSTTCKDLTYYTKAYGRVGDCYAPETMHGKDCVIRWGWIGNDCGSSPLYLKYDKYENACVKCEDLMKIMKYDPSPSTIYPRRCSSACGEISPECENKVEGGVCGFDQNEGIIKYCRGCKCEKLPKCGGDAHCDTKNGWVCDLSLGKCVRGCISNDNCAPGYVCDKDSKKCVKCTNNKDENGKCEAADEGNRRESGCTADPLCDEKSPGELILPSGVPYARGTCAYGKTYFADVCSSTCQIEDDPQKICMSPGSLCKDPRGYPCDNCIADGTCGGKRAGSILDICFFGNPQTLDKCSDDCKHVDTNICSSKCGADSRCDNVEIGKQGGCPSGQVCGEFCICITPCKGSLNVEVGVGGEGKCEVKVSGRLQGCKGFKWFVYENNCYGSKRAEGSIEGDDYSIGEKSWYVDAGRKYKYVLCVDSVERDSKEVVCSPDKTPPETNVEISSSSSNLFIIKLKCEDKGGSGCDKTYYCIDTSNTCENYQSYSDYDNPFSHTCEKECYIRFYSVDKVGNKENVKSQKFGIRDIIPPSTKIYCNDVDCKDGWYNGDVKIKFECEDKGGSGCDKTYYCMVSSLEDIERLRGCEHFSTYRFQSQILVTTEGQNSFTFYSVDKAGNRETPKSQVIKIDKTSPQITVTHSPQAPTSSDKVTYTAIATDSLSRIKEIKIYVDNTLKKTCTSSPCEYKEGPYAAGSTPTYYATVIDNAENVARDPP
ncbi:MAG: hypothetical protein QXI58_04345, partial [Candidatus Micrarchaeia archaeon]